MRCEAGSHIILIVLSPCTVGGDEKGSWMELMLMGNKNLFHVTDSLSSLSFLTRQKLWVHLLILSDLGLKESDLFRVSDRLRFYVNMSDPDFPKCCIQP